MVLLLAVSIQAADRSADDFFQSFTDEWMRFNTKDLRAQAERLVVNQVYPVWRKAIALLESGLPHAADDAGLWRLPKGAEAYAHALRQYTTTKMTADEIHQTGLRVNRYIQGKKAV